MQNINQICLSDEFVIDMQQVLGKGSTGCVYEGKNIKNNQKVAVKMIELNTINNEVTTYLLKMQKIAIMSTDNEYVMKGLKIIQDNKYCYLILQYCNNGTLRKLIKTNGSLPQQKSLQILRCILLGYSNLVQNGIIHRDLKPANIMLHNTIPKIIDFGYCQISGYNKPTLKYNVGSPSYMAPQSHKFNLYNQKSQIWALGVTLYQCLIGNTIDNGRKISEIYQEIKQNGVKLPQSISEKTKNIIKLCLSIDPMKRPTCMELLSKYFININKNIINQPNICSERKTTFSKNININSIQKQNKKEIKNTTSKNLSPIDKISLFNCTVKDVLKTTQQPRNSYTHRTNLLGTLPNPQHEIYRKYFQNRTKTTFSNYQTIKHIKQPSNFIPTPNRHLQQKQRQIRKKTQLLSPPNPSTNDYCIYRNNTPRVPFQNCTNNALDQNLIKQTKNKNTSPIHSIHFNPIYPPTPLTHLNSLPNLQPFSFHTKYSKSQRKRSPTSTYA